MDKQWGHVVLDPRFVLLGAAFSMVGSISYAILTVRGRVRPNRVSWFLWGAAPMIAFFAQLHDGVGLPAISTLAIGLGPFVILAASFVNRSSYWQITAFDLSCGAVSVLALVLWLTFDNPLLAVLAALAADAIGGIPTIVKAWRRPDTERSTVYVGTALNGTITLLSLQTWTLAEAAFPLYLVLLGVGLATTVKMRTTSDRRPDHPAAFTSTP
ncbi:hypothetical protein [Gordonia sp. DT101]|uniref:hypothetical protein n=1 Tax=Gordonia sp. DT101 TaxID=3416545 RepID=UPI003CEBBCBC